MDPVTIAALVAALAGSAIQYKAGTDAQDRQKAEIARSLEAQRVLQQQAESKALGAASKFATPDRVAEQSQIADQITQELIAPVSESQNIRAGQQTTQGAVSGDYKSAKAASDLNTVKAAEQLARMMGKTASSGRLRMNEGIRLMDTGQQIGTLGNFSAGQRGADNTAITQAGLIDPGMQFAGSALQGIGTAGMMGAGSAAPVSSVNAAPTLAGSAGLAPVYDVAKTSAFSQWLKPLAASYAAQSRRAY
jgi:hypothetical protein